LASTKSRSSVISETRRVPMEAGASRKTRPVI
jgi:hypothetical protein